MDTEEAIQQAIDANLTIEVAEKLYTILDNGATANKDLVVLEDDNAKMRTELERLKELEGKAALVVKQKETYDELRRELDKDRRIMEAVIATYDAHRKHIFELARIAFGTTERS